MKLMVWILSLQFVNGFLALLMPEPIGKLSFDFKLAPESYFFIVWPVLYLIIAVVGWMIWEMELNEQMVSIKRAFMFQMILHSSWPFLFFYLYLIEFSFAISLVILASVGYLMYKLWNIQRQAALLLIPYFFWLCWNSRVNYFIFAMLQGYILRAAFGKF